ncbi:hypothetical protein [Roseobacter sp.]|uniref:hypothetical protein n=1 Tax=Roseobacter sp. TaxID=1907202 RepID=UPI00386E8478
MNAWIAEALSGDTMDGRDKHVVLAADIVVNGRRLQCRASVGDLHGLDLLCALFGRAESRVDLSQRFRRTPPFWYPTSTT